MYWWCWDIRKWVGDRWYGSEMNYLRIRWQGSEVNYLWISQKFYCMVWQIYERTWPKKVFPKFFSHIWVLPQLVIKGQSNLGYFVKLQCIYGKLKLALSLIKWMFWTKQVNNYKMPRVGPHRTQRQIKPGCSLFQFYL